MGKFNPKDYTMVKDRIKWYQDDHPDYRIETEILKATDTLDSVIVKATIYKNAEEQEKGLAHSTGIAEELREAGFVNETSHVENAETSAIGRALANVDYHGSDKRPSAEEMSKVDRTKKAKKENKKKKSSKSKDKTPDDKIADKIKEQETMNEVVKFFNSEFQKRSGDEKKKFEEKYRPIANERISEIKENE